MLFAGMNLGPPLLMKNRVWQSRMSSWQSNLSIFANLVTEFTIELDQFLFIAMITV